MPWKVWHGLGFYMHRALSAAVLIKGRKNGKTGDTTNHHFYESDCTRLVFKWSRGQASWIHFQSLLTQADSSPAASPHHSGAWGTPSEYSAPTLTLSGGSGAWSAGCPWAQHEASQVCFLSTCPHPRSSHRLRLTGLLPSLYSGPSVGHDSNFSSYL